MKKLDALWGSCGHPPRVSGPACLWVSGLTAMIPLQSVRLPR
jgi:hypothetical protein